MKVLNRLILNYANANMNLNLFSLFYFMFKDSIFLLFKTFFNCLKITLLTLIFPFYAHSESRGCRSLFDFSNFKPSQLTNLHESGRDLLIPEFDYIPQRYTKSLSADYKTHFLSRYFLNKATRSLNPNKILTQDDIAKASIEFLKNMRLSQLIDRSTFLNELKSVFNESLNVLDFNLMRYGVNQQFNKSFNSPIRNPGHWLQLKKNILQFFPEILQMPNDLIESIIETNLTLNDPIIKDYFQQKRLKIWAPLIFKIIVLSLVISPSFIEAENIYNLLFNGYSPEATQIYQNQSDELLKNLEILQSDIPIQKTSP